MSGPDRRASFGTSWMCLSSQNEARELVTDLKSDPGTCLNRSQFTAYSRSFVAGLSLMSQPRTGRERLSPVLGTGGRDKLSQHKPQSSTALRRGCDPRGR